MAWPNSPAANGLYARLCANLSLLYPTLKTKKPYGRRQPDDKKFVIDLRVATFAATLYSVQNPRLAAGVFLVHRAHQ